MMIESKNSQIRSRDWIWNTYDSIRYPLMVIMPTMVSSTTIMMRGVFGALKPKPYAHQMDIKKKMEHMKKSTWRYVNRTRSDALNCLCRIRSKIVTLIKKIKLVERAIPA
jgi:hypothetical protein